MSWYLILCGLYVAVGVWFSYLPSDSFKAGQEPFFEADYLERSRYTAAGDQRRRRAYRYWIIGGLVILLVGVLSGKLALP